jgi:hypothetical protein
MRVLPMVVIPRNYPKYTSRRVHVAEWIEGEKLSRSKADDDFDTALRFGFRRVSLNVCVVKRLPCTVLLMLDQSQASLFKKLL